MERKELKIALNNFLSPNTGHKVLLIKGDWGVGKSYFLENFIKEWGQDKDVNIAITSLFGITTFSQCIDRLHFPLQNKTSLFKNIFQVVNKFKRIIPNSIPTGLGVNLNLDNIFQTIISLMLKNGILVIDDVERKNNELKLENVLGSASYLAEKTLSKIIIVYSEKNLNENDLESINELREKVVDLEYCFSPNSYENASLIIGSEFRKNIIKELDISNIRIIKKIDYSWSELIDKFEFKSDFIKKDITKTIAILCLIHYSDIFPFKLDDVPNQLDWLVSREEDEKVKWAKQLEKKGYYFDEREYPIFDFLKLGYVDEIKWQNAINSFEENHQSEKFSKEISNLWLAFNGNFKPNFLEVTSAFVNFLDTNSEKMYPKQILEMQRLLENIGYDFSEKNWLKMSISNNLDKLSSYDLKALKAKINDPDVLNLIQEKEDSDRYESSIEIAMDKIVFKGSWNQEDTQVLINATEDDFKNWLKNSDNPNLLSMIRKGYSMLKQFDKSYHQAAKNLYDAATHIALESETEDDRKLNLERINTFLKNE